MLTQYQRGQSLNPSSRGSNQSSNKVSQQKSSSKQQRVRDDFGVMDIFQNNFQVIDGSARNIFSEFDKMKNAVLKQFDDAFSGFGGFGAFGGGSLMKPFSFQDEIMNMMNFSELHPRIQSSNSQNGPFTTVSRSYVQSTKIGPDGKRHSEKYFSNNVVQKGSDGNTISERQQAYKNTANKRDVIAQERMLNNQGRKFIKERVNGQINSTDHYFNLEENRLEDFDQKWAKVDNQLGFSENAAQYFGWKPSNQIKHNEENYYPQQSSGSSSAQQFQRKSNNKQQQQQQPNNFLPFSSSSSSQNFDYKDDVRRGDYQPYQNKMENMPVRLNSNTYSNTPPALMDQGDGFGYRRTDLQATQPARAPQQYTVINHNSQQQQQQLNQPIALGMGGPAIQTQYVPVQRANIAHNVMRPVQQNYQQQPINANLGTRNFVNEHPVRGTTENNGIYRNRVVTSSFPKAG